MEHFDASKIGTHYYKIGHIKGARYSIYQLNNNNDQALLELELAIRYKYPNILLTYYNKGLYHFQFDHINIDIDLLKEYPDLFCKGSGNVTIENICNPSKSINNNNSTTNTSDEGTPNNTNSARSIENVPFLGISLMKSIKKLMLFRLSKQGCLKLFGNYSVIEVNDSVNHVIFIEPMALPNGDLIVCTMQKSNLQLFNSSILPVDDENDLSSNFIIYLTPSGIRCHLFDNLKVLNSFTYTSPKNKDHVLNLLKLATGIDLSQEENLLWVKLIPNLQHLNNQTSKISKFIHSVDNKKYILWPWKLCLLQFGKIEKILTDDHPVRHVKSDLQKNDPLDLISEFMDFNISLKHQLQQSNFNSNIQNTGSVPHNIPTFNAPSVLSTTGSIEHKNDLAMEVNDMPMIHDLFGAIPNSVNQDFFDEDVKIINNIDAINNTEIEMNNGEEDAGKEDEIDELFGEESGDDEDIKDGSDQKEQLDEDQALRDDETADNDTKNGIPMDNVFDDTENRLQDRSSTAIEDSSNFVFDLPKEQMTLSVINKDASPYDDPGAPLPSMTPFVPSTEKLKSRSTNGHDSEVSSSKSVFSPILFNPLIKSNVDDKYGKGGKFYVNKDTKDIENNSSRLRATSVTGYEIRRPDDKFMQRGSGIDFQDNKVFPDSDADNIGVEVEDEEDDDDDDEEEEDVENDYSFHGGLNISFNNNNNEDEEEESDEDADIDLDQQSPLKLNIRSNSIDPLASVPTVEPIQSTKIPFSVPFTNTHLNTGGFSSPLSTGLLQSSKINPMPKFDSPFAMNDSPGDDKVKYSSPLALENDDFRKQTVTQNALIPSNSTNYSTAMSSSGDSKSSVITESSNCLPLILRGVNVSSIPNEFLLNNIFGAIKMSASASDFNMDVDQDEEDFEIGKKNELMVKVDNLNEFLNWIGPNLVFDLGLNELKREVVSDIPGQNNPEKEEYNVVDAVTIPKKFEEKFMEEFPFTYRIRLDELLSDFSDSNTQETYSLDTQLTFLDDITNDEILNPKSKIKKLQELEWDSIYHDSSRNEATFKEYSGMLKEINESLILDTGDAINSLTDNKIRVLKNQKEIINLNSVSLRFWKYLNFDPIYGTKSFQLLMISEMSCGNNSNYNSEFLDSLIYNYKECNFGTVSKISLEPSGTRPDLESITNGLITIANEDNYNSVYKQINKKLNSLVELIKLDLINKTNRFEFDRPLLLMFVDFNPNLNSLVEISKICRNFKVTLKRHQLPLVQVFSKVIPADFIIKEYNNSRHLRILSNYALTQLSMNLYNQCPDISKSISESSGDLCPPLFTTLVKEPISKFNFKLFNNTGGNKDNHSDNDAFLHLAYERSIDKNWVSAAWSDPLGVVTYTKSWCNASGLLKPSNATSNQGNMNDINSNVHDLHSIADQIFEISNTLFKKLNNEIINRTSGLGGKKFLVLTRVNSIIPDDELVHWKRLSMKCKDISLIVLSVNGSPKDLFEDTNNSNTDAQSPVKDQNENILAEDNGLNTKVSKQAIKIESQDPSDFFRNFNNMPNSNGTSPNNSNLMTSPSNTFNFGVSSTTNFLSPDLTGSLNGQIPTSGNVIKSDTNHNVYINKNETKDVILSDPKDSVTALIPTISIPPYNTPTRPGMKVGYLTKKYDSKHLVFEVHLLSCSNYWNLKSLMMIVLNHYKKMITLNDILCTRTVETSFVGKVQEQNYHSSGLIPWHIMAVTKTLNYLVHIDVQE